MIWQRSNFVKAQAHRRQNRGSFGPRGGEAMKRIAFKMSAKAFGEAERGFKERLETGFWDAFVRDGSVVDVGYKGGSPDAEPIFSAAIGLDMDTPGYDGRNFPFADDSVGTVHASHLLEHIADYQFFLQDAMRVLRPGGTLILMLPLMQAYEHKLTPPSRFNGDHRRFYTAARLCAEIESSLPRSSYRLLHLKERFNMADLARDESIHAQGPFYEIECVLEKTSPGMIYF
jgi:SAM-dependent methyltransferase